MVYIIIINNNIYANSNIEVLLSIRHEMLAVAMIADGTIRLDTVYASTSPTILLHSN